MKHTQKILLGSLLAIALQIVGSGCIGPGDGGGVVYGGGAWFHDDVWVDGGGRGSYRGHDREVYVHPGGGDKRGGDEHRR